MNLFESQINNLNLSPSMKQSIIELRKVCLESDVGGMPNLDFEKQQAEAAKNRAAFNAIKDTINLAMKEVGENLPSNVEGEALGQAVLKRIQDKYCPQFDKTYGEGWGKKLDMEAKKRLHKLALL